jgi:ankyrin repeat protein
MLVAGDTNPNLLLLRQLLDKKPKVNDVDVEGRTALYHAVEHHNTEIVKLLVENGADPKLSANNHISPVLLAEKKGYSDLIRIIEGVKTN